MFAAVRDCLLLASVGLIAGGCYLLQPASGMIVLGALILGLLLFGATRPSPTNRRDDNHDSGQDTGN